MDLVRVTNRWIDGDFYDPVYVWQWFLDVVNRLPGVTVLGSIKHEFPGSGFSGLILLGESHAAIHTFPEHDKAWIELATCGDPASIEIFNNLTYS